MKTSLPRIHPKKKPERKKAEKERPKESPNENVCSCCGNEAQLFVEMNNSTNTGCLIPTFKDCKFHNCRFPEMKTSKIAEGEDASRPKKEEEESEEDGRIENKEKKAETAE